MSGRKTKIACDWDEMPPDADDEEPGLHNAAYGNIPRMDAPHMEAELTVLIDHDTTPVSLDLEPRAIYVSAQRFSKQACARKLCDRPQGDCRPVRCAVTRFL